MKYYIFRVEWSQTDYEMVIVQAASRDAAEAYLKRNNNHRYVTCYGEVDSITKA